jgi:hypothetical protein
MQYRDIVICGIIGNCHINIIGDKICTSTPRYEQLADFSFLL